MLGSRIAALRREAGMSQADLAVRLKVSPSAVGMYEQGRREPSVDALRDLADIFGVSVDYLVRGAPADDRELGRLEAMLRSRIAAADSRERGRKDRPFSREELAVLFAAMLME